MLTCAYMHRSLAANKQRIKHSSLKPRAHVPRKGLQRDTSFRFHAPPSSVATVLAGRFHRRAQWVSDSRNKALKRAVAE